ncbi:hypothetical protein LNO18_11090 [Klebsiella variicola subsp. variicola]|nr:hypothetical protein [Klebsiella variicola subsp. variicola]
MLLNNQTGQLLQVTDGTANETDPVVDGGGVLSWTSDRDSSVPAGNFIWRKVAKFILSFPGASWRAGAIRSWKTPFL